MATELTLSSTSSKVATASRLSTLSGGRLGDQHLAGAPGQHLVEFGDADELIGHHEQSTAVRTAQHGSETSAIELDSVEDLSALSHAHPVALVRRRPDRVFGV
jgi:hypothetical protein